MRLTKFEHATVMLEESGKKLFIDPGSFTTPLTDTAHTAAVVITHEHADHWTPAQLNRIVQLNPDVPIYGPAGVARAARDFNVTVVEAGDAVVAAPFTLRFYGGEHAVIHSSIPVVDNVGVLVNDMFYYPGDSFVVPEGADVHTLAVPSSGPWQKASEFMDFTLAVAPRLSLSTHDMINSAAGKKLANERIAWATEQHGGRFVDMSPGESIDLTS